MSPRLRAILAVVALAFSSCAAADFTFALLGDAPYSAAEETAFVDMLREIDREDIAFVVHVGDFKNGWTTCSDAVFDQRRELFNASRHAFVYIPGDNEWSDCARLLAGGYDPLERLAALRTRFFRGSTSLGQTPMALTRQSDRAGAPAYPEHMRWRRDHVMFVTLNLPGGDNNAGMPAESAARTAAALAWLQQAFAEARTEGLRGVVVLTQANPFSSSGGIRRSFAGFIAVLARETTNYAGAVLLGHGDTHIHRVDQPLKHPDNGSVLRNFTRAEVFGSPQVNWLRVRVTDDGTRSRFEVSAGR